MFQASLNSYLAVLNAIGDSGVQACPPMGSKLRQNLQDLQTALAKNATPAQFQETGQRAETEIAQFGAAAAGYFKQRAGEAKELMLILARTAEVTGERDQRYSGQFHEFTNRLKSMADLDDLRMIRDSLVKSAIDLRTCAEAMAEESQRSVARLRADVTVYQTRLDDAEKLAGQDPLTGLDNRRRVESAIEFRIAQMKPFSVLILDLNAFKHLNDTCGHQAADDLLRQFSAELKAGCRAGDVVGRLGGDEFIVILDAGLEEANARVDRISRWVFGEYTIRVGESARKVALSAAIGAAEWRAGDTLRTLLDRADAAMYQEKRSTAR